MGKRFLDYLKKIKMPKELKPATRDYTIVLARRIHKVQFKKKAPRAIKMIKKFAAENMRTKDVRVDVKLNQHVWSQGIRNVPKRVRVRLWRKKDEDDESGSKWYTLVQLLNVENFDGLRTENNTGKVSGKK